MTFIGTKQEHTRKSHLSKHYKHGHQNERHNKGHSTAKSEQAA